jgi:uncharacterized membrane protein YccC
MEYQTLFPALFALAIFIAVLGIATMLHHPKAGLYIGYIAVALAFIFVGMVLILWGCP